MFDPHFQQYGDGLNAAYLSELVALQNETGGDLLARVEESGSEGQYCEVARWSDVWGWTRFAFYKFLGGEGLTAQDATDQINNAAWHRGKCSLIHRLPDYAAATTLTDSSPADVPAHDEPNAMKGP